MFSRNKSCHLLLCILGCLFGLFLLPKNSQGQVIYIITLYVWMDDDWVLWNQGGVIVKFQMDGGEWIQASLWSDGKFKLIVIDPANIWRVRVEGFGKVQYDLDGPGPQPAQPEEPIFQGTINEEVVWVIP